MSASRRVAIAVLLPLILSPLAARTLTVDDDGPADYRTIQAAIDAAAAGDVVSVAPGAYPENLRLKSGVAVVGSGSDVTVVDGGGRGPAARLSDCDSTTRLEGFRLTGGAALLGGGVRIDRGAPVVRFNAVLGNRAVGSGTAYGYGGGVAVLASAAVISDNVVSGNEADFGGGLHIDGGSPRIARNTITGNTAGAGGGIDAYVVSGTPPLITANAIRQNSAQYGGGLELAGPGAPVVSNNLILGNTASGGGQAGLGGGADAYYSGAHLVNNTVAGNGARRGGGVAVVAIGAPRVASNIFLDNDASAAGGALDLEAPGAVVQANIFHLNTGGTCGGASAWLCADPSNLETDPLLVDPAGSDHRPRPGSPAIDTGHSAGAPPDDARGQRRPLDGDRDGIAAHDRGAYEYDRDDVPGVGFAEAARLVWGPVPGAARYHVYSGLFTAAGRAVPDVCRDADDADPLDLEFRDTAGPAPGEALAYLVTAVVGSEERSAGFDGAGLERVLPAPCP
jgi:hypothetical protein